MSKYTMPENINWDNIDIEKDIDWDNIDFLFVEVTDDNVIEIKRYESIPQFGGLIPIMAYAKNLKRMILRFKGGDEVLKTIDDNLLLDMAMTLARGGSIPFGMGAK